ncbi:MAG: hypothetical protein KDD53_03600, partial [Bdellovibrionales bacterium]|nr:hypothetical protein [Bdellovibrionales bacterium]
MNFNGVFLWLDYTFLSVDFGETLYHVRELELGRIPYKDIFSHHFMLYIYLLKILDRFVGFSPFTTHWIAVCF